MQRPNVVVFVLVFTMAVLGVSLTLRNPLLAQGDRTTKKFQTERPGDAQYVPTKLEWAAVELQAGYGSEWTSDYHVASAFTALDDGKTVLCLLQYTPDVTADAVKTQKRVTEIIFEKYAQRHGWPWLRLQFQERTLPRPN
jgi:hypothetical protein